MPNIDRCPESELIIAPFEDKALCILTSHKFKQDINKHAQLDEKRLDLLIFYRSQSVFYNSMFTDEMDGFFYCLKCSLVAAHIISTQIQEWYLLHPL